MTWLGVHFQLLICGSAGMDLTSDRHHLATVILDMDVAVHHELTHHTIAFAPSFQGFQGFQHELMLLRFRSQLIGLC